MTSLQYIQIWVYSLKIHNLVAKPPNQKWLIVLFTNHTWLSNPVALYTDDKHAHRYIFPVTFWVTSIGPDQTWGTTKQVYVHSSDGRIKCIV